MASAAFYQVSHILFFIVVVVVSTVCLVNGTESEMEDSGHSNALELENRALNCHGCNHGYLLKLIRHLQAKVKLLALKQYLLHRGTNGRDGRDGRDGSPGRQGRPGGLGRPGTAGRPGARGPKGLTGASSGGTQYTRWGKTTCPSSASLVYKGWMGGEHFTHQGGGVNYLCLTEQPKYGYYKRGFQTSGRVYGTEYEVNTVNPFGNKLHDHEAPCAVCYVKARGTKLMIPATNVCPAGWTREYHGYLMTAFFGHAHPADYVCVDAHAEAVPSSAHNHNGALLYVVEGTCGSLPCGPYFNARELTCVVCTK